MLPAFGTSFAMELPASPTQGRGHWTARFLPISTVLVGATLEFVTYILSFWVHESRLLAALGYTGGVLSGLGLAGLLLGGLGRSRQASLLQILCAVAAIAFWTVAVIKLATTSGFDRYDSVFRWTKGAGVLSGVAFALGFVAEPLPKRLAHAAFALSAALAIALAIVGDAVVVQDMVLWYVLASLPVTLAAAALLPYWRAPGATEERQ
jgi:hypothetical protein